MKHYLVLLLALAVVFSTELSGQGGYQKNVMDGYSNALVGCKIHSNKLYLMQFINDDFRGFYPSLLEMDTFGHIIERLDAPFLKNAVGISGDFNDLLCLGSNEDFYSILVSQNGIALLNFDLKSIKSVNVFNLRSDKNDLYLPNHIMTDSLKNLYITGHIQFEESLGKTFGFLLKLDIDGKILYWKLFENDKDGFELTGSFINSKGNIMTYGNRLKLNPHCLGVGQKLP